MSVASLELCKELYERSSWRNTEHFHVLSHKNKWIIGGNPQHENYALESLENNQHVFKPGRVYPAYDLGYLLRKLWSDGLRLTVLPGHRWELIYAEHGLSRVADAPEDAACKLAIELFKRGILT